MELPCQDKKRVFAVIDIVRKCEFKRGRNPHEVFTQGNCGDLYRFLKRGFHCANVWARKDSTFNETLNEELYYGHVLTEIGKRVYDIDGVKAEYELADCDNLCNGAFADREVASMVQNFNQSDVPYDPMRENRLMRETMGAVNKFVKSGEFTSPECLL